MSEHSRVSPCGVCEAPDSVNATKALGGDPRDSLVADSMSTQPTVCCVMLANGREEMVRRAIRSFQAQTYQAKRLLLWDTAEPRSQYKGNNSTVLHCYPAGNGETIGALRNAANDSIKRLGDDIIFHWDSDDWSHPNRIAEQVALLEASGKEAVGYRDMLFWQVCKWCWSGRGMLPNQICDECTGRGGEAWLYTNRNPQYCLGTSLCYWREVWQRNPFADTSAGEDTLWLRGVKSQGERSFPDLDGRVAAECMPRMIASIHGGNTYARIEPRAEEWRRVPEWDAHCREVMAL